MSDSALPAVASADAVAAAPAAAFPKKPRSPKAPKPEIVKKKRERGEVDLSREPALVTFKAKKKGKKLPDGTREADREIDVTFKRKYYVSKRKAKSAEPALAVAAV